MPRVGNDIVDLDLPENRGRSRDRRFVERVFTPGEQAAIERSACPDNLLWALWAAKEAAFKAVSRDDPDVCSVPRRYEVSLDEPKGDGSPLPAVGATLGGGPGTASLSGVVQTPCGELAVRITATEDWVHALAAESAAALARMTAQIDGPDDDEAGNPSQAVRSRVVNCLAGRWNCPAAAFEIRKDTRGPGIPRLFLNQQEMPVAVSLSHDGRYTAFALDMPV